MNLKIGPSKAIILYIQVIGGLQSYIKIEQLKKQSLVKSKYILYKFFLMFLVCLISI